MTEPCEPWPLDLSCCPEAEDADPEQVERWARVATVVLWRMSGMRWGPSCPVVVRPCGRSCWDEAGLGRWLPGVVGGRWVPYQDAGGVWRNASLCGCRTSCSCTQLCEVRLDGPVYDIVSVWIDGVEYAPEAWRLDGNTLVMVGTDGVCWPACQDLTLPGTEPGTAEIVYRTGLRLDAAAIAAVSELTCHYLKGCSTAGSGSCGSCRPNPRVSRVDRQGVTIDMIDPTALYADGRTGQPLADQWLATVNPYRRWSPSRVYSPDMQRPRRVGPWPAV